jgi:hypothetical protein
VTVTLCSFSSDVANADSQAHTRGIGHLFGGGKRC